MIGMGESASVVGIHAVTIYAAVRVTFAYVPWLLWRWRDILRNPVGTLVYGFGVLAVGAAIEGAYYGTARILAFLNQREPGLGGRTLWDWTAFITLIQSVNAVAALLALVAVWRLESGGLSGVPGRIARVVGEFLVLYAMVTFTLW